VDTLLDFWVIWRVKEWVLGNTPLFYAPQLFYPEGISVITQSLGPILGVIGLPFWLIGPEAAYNGAIFISIWFTGYCGYLLARTLDLKWFSSIIVGLILLLAPIHLPGILGHLQKIFIGFTPLIIISLKRSLELRRSKLWILITALLVFSTLMYTGYQFLFSIITITYFTSLSLLDRKGNYSNQYFLRIILLVMALLTFTLPFGYEFIHAHEGIFVDLHYESEFYSPDAIQLILPSIYHPIFGPKAGSLLKSISPSTITNLETNINLFISGIFLCGVAIWKKWKQAKWWVIFTGLCIVIALGPSLKIFGLTEFTSYKYPILLPYAFMGEFPGLDNIRVPGRFMLLAYVGFSVTAGYGFDWIMERVTKKRIRFSIVIVTIALILFEGWPIVWPVSEIPEPPIFYKQIKDDEEMYGVVDIPLKHPEEASIYNIYQMTHQKGMLNGYVSRVPQYHPFFQDLMEPNLPPDIHINGNPLSMDQFENFLYQYDYRFFVKHKDFGGEDLFANLYEWISVNREPFHEDDQTVVYKILPITSKTHNESSAAAFHGIGWWGYEQDSSLRWAQSPSELIIFSQIDQMVLLVLYPKWLFNPFGGNAINNTGSIELKVNDDPITRIGVESDVPSVACLKINQGLNQVWFSVPAGNFVPKEKDPESEDGRSLSFSLSTPRSSLRGSLRAHLCDTCHRRRVFRVAAALPF